MPSLGFGIEKLGLLAVRAPRLTLLIILLVSAICAFGLPKLSSDDALSELFRSSTVEFRNYEALKARFPTSEFDILVIVEKKTIFEQELLEEVRTLHLELQFIKSVHEVISLFSMREAPDDKGYAAPIFPAELPEGDEFNALANKVENHPLIKGKLLSNRDDDSQITLLIISLKPGTVAKEGLGAAIEEIRKLSEEIIEPTGAKVQLAGMPVMQYEVRSAIKRDRLIYNSVGFVVGFIICLLFFRRPVLVFIATACPALAVLWSLGILGLMEIKLNTFLNVISPLVMVIAFSDALHMVFSIRRQIAQGKDRYAAAAHAVRMVGPACVLTSLTTSIALLSMTWTDSGLIRVFGYAAALATLLAFVTVILVVPTLTVLLMKNEGEFAKSESTEHKGIGYIEDVCGKLAQWIAPRHLRIALIGCLFAAMFTGMHLELEPRYRLSDQVPDNMQSVTAAAQLDKKLTGALPIHIMIRWGKNDKIDSEKVLGAAAEVHQMMSTQQGIGNVWSVDTLSRWLKENVAEPSPKLVADYLRKLPKQLTGRFVNEKEQAALVTGRLKDLDADETVPIVRDMEKKLEQIKEKYPDLTFTISGLSTVSALQSANMISQLNQGLLIAVLIVIFLIGIAFRSPTALLLSILPNLFPIVATGSLLYISGKGLEYASVIGLTVAFGLAVDDTIHFLNRLYIERNRQSDLYKAVIETIIRIGPVLVLTTIVLVLGLAVTIFSALPPMRLFGMLAMTMLVAALIGDVLILPGIILSLRKMGFMKKKA